MSETTVCIWKPRNEAIRTQGTQPEDQGWQPVALWSFMSILIIKSPVRHCVSVREEFSQFKSGFEAVIVRLVAMILIELRDIWEKLFVHGDGQPWLELGMTTTHSKAYSEDLRWVLVYMHQKRDLSVNDIERLTGLKPCTIRRILKLFEETGKVMPPAPKSGQPKKLDGNDIDVSD